MFLAVAATEIEMAPLLQRANGGHGGWASLICGVGPVEASLRLSRFLSMTVLPLTGIINFGVAGAYLQPPGQPEADLLDICLAEREVLGDLGVCLPDGMEYLPEALTGALSFQLDHDLCRQAGAILARHGLAVLSGTSITVSAVSGSRQRGEFLRQHWQGLFENMEGAAIARICAEFSLPLLEIRCISNKVDDRSRQEWQLAEACRKAAETALLVLQELK